MDRNPSNASTEIATTGRPNEASTPLLSGSDGALAEEYRRGLSIETPVPVLAPGTRLGERYEIVGKLGQGGMGLVYEARNTNVEHIRYAIKTLLPGASRADTTYFLQEARRASKVRSPHVVQIFDFGTDAATGLVYMVMDYIGEDLEKYTARRGGTLPAAKAVDFCAQTCEALSAAHAEKVVHRDIKPLNCLLRIENGREVVVVTDFGIAREFKPVVATQDGAEANTEWTAVGTLGYVAPEIWLREGKADHRIDIYSVGAMLYKLLTGRPPPLAPRLDELEQRGIPPLLIPILSMALARSPKDRFASAEMMHSKLREVLPLLGAAAVLPAPQSRLGGLIATSVVLVILAIALSTALYFKRGASVLTEDVPEKALEIPIVRADKPTGTTAADPQKNPQATSSAALEAKVEQTIPKPAMAPTKPPTKPPKDSIKPKPQLLAFADKKAELTAMLKSFCGAKNGMLACTGKLKLKQEGRFQKVPLEITLWFRFIANSSAVSLESRDLRLDLGQEAEFKKCVEAQLLRTQWVSKTRDGGLLSYPVSL